LAGYLQGRVLGGGTTKNVPRADRIANLIRNCSELARAMNNNDNLKDMQILYGIGSKKNSMSFFGLSNILSPCVRVPNEFNDDSIWFFGFRRNDWPAFWAVGLESAGDGWFQYWGGLRALQGKSWTEDQSRLIGRRLELSVLFAPRFLSRPQMSIGGKYWTAVATFAPPDDVLCTDLLPPEKISELADWFKDMIIAVENARDFWPKAA
jgi:hypothetical protein